MANTSTSTGSSHARAERNRLVRLPALAGAGRRAWRLSEPTLGKLLSDPIVQALMAADQVRPDELEADLNQIAGVLRQHSGSAKPDSRLRPSGNAGSGSVPVLEL